MYQYRFETARVNGKRKYISKSGFKTKHAAFIAGQKAYEEYQNGGFYDLRGSYATKSLKKWCRN